MISTGPIEDRLMIRELVDSYNDAVMRFDKEAWAANWTDDATWVLPGTGDGVTGKENFVPMWEGAMANFGFVGFFASAGPIIVDGDKAHGTWYQQEFLQILCKWFLLGKIRIQDQTRCTTDHYHLDYTH